MQPTSNVTLWKGRRQTLGTVATAGTMVTAKYRITEDALIFASGLVSTKEEVIPLWAVMDVDLSQTMTQKMRGVGDLTIRLDPAGARYGQTTVSIESVREPREVRDLLSRQANIMRSMMLDYQHNRELQRRQAGATQLNVGTAAPVAAPASEPWPAPHASADPHVVMEQLRRLGELKDAGVLTDAEFNGKKADLLSRL